MHRPARLAVALLIACVPAPDGDRAEAAGSVGIGPEPRLIVGVSDGDPGQMFHLVMSARRLGDGSIVIADGGSRQVRRFAGTGEMLWRAGRRGRGPGEFEGAPRLLAWPGDSVVAYDPTLHRELVLSPEGELVRTRQLEAGEAPAGLALPMVFRRTVVIGAADSVGRACVAEVLRRRPIRPVEEGLRLLLVDDTGRFWLREGPDTASRWTVLRRDGTPLGTPALPAGFDLLQTGTDFVVVRTRADDDTERVAVFPLDDDRDAGECLPGATPPPATEVPRILQVQTRNMMVAQEATYADLGRYGLSIPAGFLREMEGTRHWILTADSGGWLGGTLDLTSELACVTALGPVLPGWWRDGYLACG